MKKLAPFLILIVIVALNFGCFPNIPAVSNDGKLIAVTLNKDAAYYTDHLEFGREPKANHEKVLYTRDLFVFSTDGKQVWRVTDFDGHVSYPSFGHSNDEPDKIMFVYTPSEDQIRYKHEEIRDTLYVINNLKSSFKKLNDAPTFSKAIESQGFGNEMNVIYQSSISPRGYILMPVFSPDNNKIAFIETTNSVKLENLRTSSYSGDLKVINLNETDEEKRIKTIAQNCVPRISWADDNTILYAQLGDEIKAPFAGTGSVIKHNITDNKTQTIWQGEISRYIVNIATTDSGEKIVFDSTNGINGVFQNKIMLYDGKKVSELSAGEGFGMPTFADDNTIKFFAPTYENRQLKSIKLGSIKLENDKPEVEFTELKTSIGNFYKYYLTPDFLFTIPSVTESAKEITGSDLKIMSLKQTDAKEAEFIKTGQKTVKEHTPDKNFILRRARERAGLIDGDGKAIEINDTTTVLNVTAYDYKLDKDKKPVMNARNGDVVYIMQVPKPKSEEAKAIPGKIRFEQNIIGSGQDVKCWDGRYSYQLEKEWVKYDPMTKDPIMRDPSQDLAEELTDMMRGRRLYLLQNILEPLPDEDKSKHKAAMLVTRNVVWDYQDEKPILKKLAYLQIVSEYKLQFNENKTIREYVILGFEVGDLNSKDYGLLREIRILKNVSINRRGKIKTDITSSIFRLDDYKEFSKIDGNSIYLPFNIVGYNSISSIMSMIYPGKSQKVLDAKIVKEFKYSHNSTGMLISGINTLPLKEKSRNRVFNSLKWGD